MDSTPLKEQRDRYLAFSFAVSDIIIEVCPKGTIQYMAGATKNLLGKEENFFYGKSWLELFCPLHHPTLSTLHGRAKPGKRCGPVLAEIEDASGKNREVAVGAILIEKEGHFYISLSLANPYASGIASRNRKEEVKRPLNKEEFLRAAQTMLQATQSAHQESDLTLLTMVGAETVKINAGESEYQALKKEIYALLEARSIDGQSVAEIKDGKFSLIHDRNVRGDSILQQVKAIAGSHAGTAGVIDFESHTVEANIHELSDKEVSKALLHTLEEFEKKGSALSVDTLSAGFQAFLAANQSRMCMFKDIISSAGFKLHFQPIINLHSNDVSHYEMLCRFKDSTTPYEWISFAESVDLVAEFDLAVIKRAINYITHIAKTNNLRFAVNVSGNSIQKPEFFQALIESPPAPDVCRRILFEITESSKIEKLDLVASYVTELQKKGFQCCLDDFGAGSASFQYLQKLHVNYVKIDGAYIKNLLTDKRDYMMIKNITRMCHDLNIQVVAEHIETAPQAKKLKMMGVDLGQGFLFSKPQAEPSYKSRVLKNA